MANTVELSSLIQEITQYYKQYTTTLQTIGACSASLINLMNNHGKQLVSAVEKLLSYNNSKGISSSSNQPSTQEIADLKIKIKENLISFLADVCYIETLLT